jgi:magnesium-transporting ATPase (P-type)
LLWLSWRKRLNWQHHLIPILLISLLTTPYGWTFDQVVLSPLAIIMAVRFTQQPRGQLPWFAGLVIVQMIMLVVMFSARDNFVLFWVAPVLAMLYWLSSRSLSVDVHLEQGA